MKGAFASAADFVARNRRWIGGLAFSLWSVAQADPWMLAHPRLNAYGGVVAAYVFGAGKHKSDREQREEQGRISLDSDSAGRLGLK